MITFDSADPMSPYKIRIQETLRKVMDPELNINIVDLGLVYAIDVSETDMRITIDMTLSSQHCPMGEAILQSVSNCLEYAYMDCSVCVNLVWEPQWTFENITEAGLRQLEN
jgi:metal-sulfur cluster biosynthetic enzyme